MSKKRKYINKRCDDLGFTLVELMVIIVILAIFAAIAVPAFLHYLDKQKREQVIVNAKECLMSAQSLSSEQYVYGRPLYSSLNSLNTDVGKTTKLTLTGENKEGEITYVRYGSKGKDLYTIHEFRYTENGITAIWKLEDAKWIYDDEVDVEKLTGIVSGGETNSGIVNNDIVIPVSEKTPAENPPADNPPSDNPPADNPPADNPPADNPPADFPPVDNPSIDNPTGDHPVNPPVNPPTDDPPADEPENNKPGGNLVVVFEGSDVVTNVVIKNEDFWPEGQSIADAIAEAEANGDYSYQNKKINLEQGDVFIYDGVIYYVVQDQSVDYGNAKQGANVIATNWKFAFPVDTQNVLSKLDFEYHYGDYVLKTGFPGMLYFDNDENILYVTNRQGGWFNLPTIYSHDGWDIVDDLSNNN